MKPTVGVGTMLHCMPSQWSVSEFVKRIALAPAEPTAHTSSPDSAAIAYSVLYPRPVTLGLATILHCSPFQCRVSVWQMLDAHWRPTAQTSSVEIAATPYSVPS